jgi:HEAT repeat protein
VSIVTFLFGKAAPDVRPADPVRLASSCTSLEDLKEFLGHRSGYVREAAIGQAVSLRCEGAIPAVMARLNDHVSQVRDAAQRAVQTLLPFAGQGDLLAFLGYTWRLRHFSRWDHSAWIAETQSELAKRLSVAQLCEALRSDSLFAVRGSFYLLLDRGLVPRAELLALAIESRRDVLMARQAASLALSLPVHERIAVLQQGMRSHFGAVRTLALRGLLECAPNAEQIARGALLDTQGSVRSSAQFYLKKNGIELAAYYRAMLRNPVARAYVPCMALAALGSMGSSEDIALVRDHLDSPYPSIRGAALLAWLKLAPADKDSIAAAALRDESRAIRKLAANLATRQGAFIPFDRVKELLHGKRHLAVLFAFARLRKWDWIETIAIEASHCEQDNPEWNTLVVEMERWVRHAGQSYERPADGQRERLLAPETISTMEKLCKWNRNALRYELGLISKC